MKLFRPIFSALVILSLAACGAQDGHDAGPHKEAAGPVDEKAENAIETRESVLKLLKWNFGPLAGMARDKVPYNLETVRKNAPRIRQLAHMLGDTFIYDTRGSGIHTEALDRIWEDTALFSEKLQALVSASEALEVAAQNGEEAGIKAAIGGLGKSCGGCHDDFREDDD